MIGRRARLLTTAALLFALAIGGAGCGANFDPYERLEGLRILAVKTEPVSPAPGDSTTLSALVYTPPPAGPMAAPPAITYRWSWCPFAGTANDGYRCLVTEDQLRAVAPDAPPFDLPPDPTEPKQATFHHTLDPAMLKNVCAGLAGLPPPPDCRAGFPVTIYLTVTTPDDEVTAIRTLSLLLAPATEPNTNPAIGDLLAVGADGTEKPLDGATLKRHFDNGVKATVSEEAAEAYDGFDDNGKPARVQERLFISWFVETGTVKHPRTGFNATTTIPFADLLPNTWNPQRASLYGRDTAQLFAVLRDSREGVAWTSATASLEPTP
ncbi:MAG TPA: hypothetical protein VMU50_10460 [Polyangia bacterium]|nr:hypothetical protein [Polyangia bacterium]